MAEQPQLPNRTQIDRYYYKVLITPLDGRKEYRRKSKYLRVIK